MGDEDYLKLSDCSDTFRKIFGRAREAIENDEDDQLENLRAAVTALKSDRFDQLTSANTEQGMHIYALDVCEMVPDPSADDRSYPMTLLAYAGYHAKMKMLKFLISEGAHANVGTVSSGNPLLQMMVYAKMKQEDPKKGLEISDNVVKCFIKNKTDLNLALVRPGPYFYATALEMAITFHCLDMAETLIKAGANHIFGGDGTNSTLSPLFVEYLYFGTHKFLKWLLKYYESKKEVSTFISCVLDCGIFSGDAAEHEKQESGRNAAHAFLLSGHEQTIKFLVDRCHNLLGAGDVFMKTALHVAAEEGDFASVKILVPHYLRCADVNAEDSTAMTPLMLATMNKHKEIVKELQPHASQTARELTWALQYGYATYFEAMHETIEGEDKLASPLDSKLNTIAHLASQRGQVSVFKATFPRTKGRKPVFEVLKKENGDYKTPLQIAIETGNIDLLNALQERRDCRKKLASKNDSYDVQQAERFERVQWKKFWDEESPKLLLYACLHGTVEIVDYFIARRVSSTTGINWRTPLSCAAQAGKHDIVAYLLNIGVSAKGLADGPTPGVKIPVPEQYSPLMIASRFGRAKCVTLLLDKLSGPSLKVKSDRNYNCLMEAIKAGHEDTADALLRHEGVDWKNFIDYSVQARRGRKDIILYPLMMLIKEMPDVAKRVFTQCITINDNMRQIEYDYDILENYSASRHPTAPSTTSTTLHATPTHPATPLSSFPPPIPPPGSTTPPTQQLGPTALPIPQQHQELRWLNADHDSKATEKLDDMPSHPLALMVKHERLDLLQHPLISRYISYKWWRLSPILFSYIFFYILFLVLLTTFALRTPRPGPDDKYCPSNSSIVTLSFKDNNCEATDQSDIITFRALAVVIILLSAVYLLLHILQPIWTYVMSIGRLTVPAIVEAVLRPWAFVLTIVFVFGYVNDCWCAPAWQWQIGALAVFMAYINFILMLKGVPFFGVFINMLLNIVITFLKLLYLPLLLILAFAVPFYMVLVRDSPLMQADGVLVAFATPARSLAKTVISTVGELDFETIFNDGNLLYSPMAYILFIIFVILMPILFSNLLVGLAVGTTETDVEDATLKEIEIQVNHIVALSCSQSVLSHRWILLIPCWLLLGPFFILLGPFLALFRCFKWCWKRMKGVDYETEKQLVEDLRNELLHSKAAKENVTKVLGIQHSLLDYIDKSHQSLQADIADIREILEELRKRAF